MPSGDFPHGGLGAASRGLDRDGRRRHVFRLQAMALMGVLASHVSGRPSAAIAAKPPRALARTLSRSLKPGASAQDAPEQILRRPEPGSRVPPSAARGGPRAFSRNRAEKATLVPDVRFGSSSRPPSDFRDDRSSDPLQRLRSDALPSASGLTPGVARRRIPTLTWEGYPDGQRQSDRSLPEVRFGNLRAGLARISHRFRQTSRSGGGPSTCRTSAKISVFSRPARTRHRIRVFALPKLTPAWL